MMNMQTLAKIRFGNITPLTTVTVTGTGASRLTPPIRAIVSRSATTPCWIVFTCHGAHAPFVITDSIAKIMFVSPDLIRFTLKFFFTSGTINQRGASLARHARSGTPGDFTSTIAKIVPFYCTWGESLLLSAPITKNMFWREATCAIAIKVLCCLESIRLNVYRSATCKAADSNKGTLCRATTRDTAILAFTCRCSNVVKFYSALRASNSIFTHNLNVITEGIRSQVIGTLQEYCKIAAARIAWWSKWAKLTGKTDPAEIRKLGEAADAREAPRDGKRQTSIFDILE